MTPGIFLLVAALGHATAVEVPSKFRVDACWAAHMTVARAGFEVFLDPTDANRAAVTERLKREVLAPLQQVRDNTAKESTAIWATTCASFLSRAIHCIGRADSPLGGDPRRWDPPAVAIFVEQTKEADRRTVEAPPPPYSTEWPEPGNPRAQLFDNLKTLSRLGAIRAFELVKPKYVGSVPGLNAPYEQLGKNIFIALAVHIGGDHFPEELWLYEQEWEMSSPDVDLQALSGADRDDLVQRNYNYINWRWFETDRLAPHPDMDAVRKAIDELRTATPVPDKPRKRDAPQ